MSQKIITVRFLERQGCEDLYRCPGTNQVYARQPSNEKDKVFWYTTSKWNGGFEASSHVRAGIVFRVVDGSDKILFEENVYLAGHGTYAVKKGEFFSDILKNEAQRYKDLFHLVSHEEWRTSLAQEKKKHDYSGMMEAQEYCWNKIEEGGMTHFPSVTLGLDVAPRWSRSVKFPMDYVKLGYCPICTGNTPERFGEVLKKALAKDGPAIIINAWNEWTEGMALLPDTQYGTGYLDTIAKITAELDK